MDLLALFAKSLYAMARQYVHTANGICLRRHRRLPKSRRMAAAI